MEQSKAQQAENRGLKFWHRIQLSDGSWTNGLVDHGPNGGDWPTKRFGLPESCDGMAVLDIGAYDGFFSFEAEKRGARTVVAADIFQGRHEESGIETFEFVRDDLKSKVGYWKRDIQEWPAVYNFDLVLLYGVLYHVQDPYRALRNTVSKMKQGGTLLIETAYSTGNFCGMEFRPGFDNDPTNYWYPTISGLQTMLGSLGMMDVSLVYADGIRCTVKCVKA